MSATDDNDTGQGQPPPPAGTGQQFPPADTGQHPQHPLQGLGQRQQYQGNFWNPQGNFGYQQQPHPHPLHGFGQPFPHPQGNVDNQQHFGHDFGYQQPFPHPQGNADNQQHFGHEFGGMVPPMAPPPQQWPHGPGSGASVPQQQQQSSGDSTGQNQRRNQDRDDQPHAGSTPGGYLSAGQLAHPHLGMVGRGGMAYDPYQQIQANTTDAAGRQVIGLHSCIDQAVSQMIRSRQKHEPGVVPSRKWRNNAARLALKNFAQFYHSQEAKLIMQYDQRTIALMAQTTQGMERVANGTAGRVAALPSIDFQDFDLLYGDDEEPEQGRQAFSDFQTPGKTRNRVEPVEDSPSESADSESSEATQHGRRDDCTETDESQKTSRELFNEDERPSGILKSSAGATDDTAKGTSSKRLGVAKEVSFIATDGMSDEVPTMQRKKSLGKPDETGEEGNIARPESNVSARRVKEKLATIQRHKELKSAKKSAKLAKKAEKRATSVDVKPAPASMPVVAGAKDDGESKKQDAAAKAKRRESAQRELNRLRAEKQKERGVQSSKVADVVQEAIAAVAKMDESDLSSAGPGGNLQVNIEDPANGIISITSPTSGARFSPSPKKKKPAAVIPPGSEAPCSPPGRANMFVGYPSFQGTDQVDTPTQSGTTDRTKASSEANRRRFGITNFFGIGLGRQELQLKLQLKLTDQCICAMPCGRLIGIKPGLNGADDEAVFIAEPDEKNKNLLKCTDSSSRQLKKIARESRKGDILAVLSNGHSLCILMNDSVHYHTYEGNGKFSHSIMYEIVGGVRASGMTADGLLVALGAKGIFSYENKTLQGWDDEGNRVQAELESTSQPHRGIALVSKAPFPMAVVTSKRGLKKVCHLGEKDGEPTVKSVTTSLGRQSDECVLAYNEPTGILLAIRAKNDRDSIGGQAFLSKLHPFFITEQGEEPEECFVKVAKSAEAKSLLDPIQAEIFIASGDRTPKPPVHAGILTKRGLSFVKYNPALKKENVSVHPTTVDGARALASNGKSLQVLTVQEVETDAKASAGRNESDLKRGN